MTYKWEIAIRFEHGYGDPVTGGLENFYEMWKGVQGLLTTPVFREGVAEISIIPWHDHRSNEYFGAAVPYDNATSEYTETCKCGRTFSEDDEGAVRMLLGEHCDNPGLSNVELRVSLGW